MAATNTLFIGLIWVSYITHLIACTRLQQNVATELCVVVCQEVIYAPILLTEKLGQTFALAPVVRCTLYIMHGRYLPQQIVHLTGGLPRTASGKPDINILKKLASQGGMSETATSKSGGSTASSDTNGLDGPADEHPVLGPRRVVEDGGAGSSVWNIDLRSPLWQFCTSYDTLRL